MSEYPKIKAVVYMVQAGMEGGNALADILSGEVTPSGRLTDTWAKKFSDYPGSKITFKRKEKKTTELYEEGIYVGYRYFGSFGIEPLYPFGFGLSYTKFSVMPLKITLKRSNNEIRIEVGVSVENTGKTYSGKEVIQIYVSCPQGRLKKEYRRLAAFAKTKVLSPGEKQELTVSFRLYQLASYSERECAWLLEAGLYGLWIGDSAENCELSWTLNLDGDAVMVRTDNICPLKTDLNELSPDSGYLRRMYNELLSKSKRLPSLDLKAAEISTQIIEYGKIPEILKSDTAKLVESLSIDQLINLATGEISRGQGSTLGDAGISVPGSAGETGSSAEGNGIAPIVLADGPAGLRLNRYYDVVNGVIQKKDFRASIESGFFAEPEEQHGTRYYQYCTAFPVGTLLAQTWNTALAMEIGAAVGKEMDEFGVSLWLAPGMNIHKNPLCGRNFEYFSEDPLVSGVMAASITMGVQSIPGCGTTIKHFACNNSENNRMASDSVVSERALREIYLKGFEIAVKSSQPMAVMSSYNLINGIHSANCRDICTKAARDEWGFSGLIMSDWLTTKPEPGASTAAGCMRAGNDLVMPGIPSDHENIRKELNEGTLNIDDLRLCVLRTVEVILKTNQYEGAIPYASCFENLLGWLEIK